MDLPETLVRKGDVLEEVILQAPVRDVKGLPDNGDAGPVELGRIYRHELG